ANAIRRRLGSPDMVAVQEVEDLELLSALGARAGEYQAVLLKGCDFSNINVGLLYNPARIRIVSTSQLQTEAPQFRKGPCTLADGRAFAQILFDRPPLRVDLVAGSTPVTVIVNHWRSQIGGRNEQRQASADFLAAELAALASANLVLLGDFNDTEGSEPLLALAGALGLTNLSWFSPLETRYSLLFEGVSQAFDHILVSPALLDRLRASGFAHSNADFPAESRAADHDNPWAHLALP
ncbi:MAG: endonuclease/exonuclease/phosphatase family protein, partial [Bryobacteraceae bacterium]